MISHLCEHPDCYKSARIKIYRNYKEKYVCVDHAVVPKKEKQGELFDGQNIPTNKIR